ncbi:MAG: hypothetical protein LVQ95_01265 [Candidatus Micrarchaeales archaeon]|nr:hypothetical protein [Candidatus Micrarchaeales archaeon]
MMSKKLIISLTDELSAWLDGKARDGYKKASLIRHILNEYKKSDKNVNH